MDNELQEFLLYLKKDREIIYVIWFFFNIINKYKMCLNGDYVFVKKGQYVLKGFFIKKF